MNDDSGKEKQIFVTVSRKNNNFHKFLPEIIKKNANIYPKFFAHSIKFWICLSSIHHNSVDDDDDKQFIFYKKNFDSFSYFLFVHTMMTNGFFFRFLVVGLFWSIFFQRKILSRWSSRWKKSVNPHQKKILINDASSIEAELKNFF